uniref:Uncharacterized protein n=1 Tax=Anopheles culicifacies TaxID=139723 RepID=A0A182MV36_9DIPT
MRYLTRNFSAFACCCSLLLLPLGGLADAERGGAETAAKAPIHQHQHQPQSAYQQPPHNSKLHQPSVAAPAHHHQPSHHHPDVPPGHYQQQVPPPAPPPSPPPAPVPDRALSRQQPSSLATSPQPSTPQSSRPLETRNSYTVLSQAMSQAVHHEFDEHACFIFYLLLLPSHLYHPTTVTSLADRWRALARQKSDKWTLIA